MEEKVNIFATVLTEIGTCWLKYKAETLNEDFLRSRTKS